VSGEATAGGTADRPRFGRAERAAQTRPLWLMIVILLITTGALAAWNHRQQAAPPPLTVVEVRGEVPSPGHHALSGAPSVHGALRAAGVTTPGGPDAALEAGTRVVLEPGGAVRLERMDELVVVGLPVDINHASVEALATVPGLRRPMAEGIVARRTELGPFTDLSELVEVKGIGPATLKELRPFLEVRP
jgi:competence protein ComEA